MPDCAYPGKTARTWKRKVAMSEQMTGAEIVLKALKDQGVEFNVCSNTLGGKQVDYEHDLYDVEKADIVPSGVAEVASAGNGLRLYKALTAPA